MMFHKSSLGLLGFVPFLVNEKASNASWAGIDIFICAENSKIRVPIVQRHRNVANSMRKIPTTDATLKYISRSQKAEA